MKEEELRTLAQCCACRRKIGQLKLPIFHKVTAQRFILDVKALQRQSGLESMVGSVALAQIMSPGEDLAVSTAKATVMICDECVLDHLSGLFEAMQEQEPVDGD